MSALTIPNILMTVFSITTLLVLLYPLVRLTPSWLERSVAKKVVAHRDALTAISAALAAGNEDVAQIARLQAQHDFHRAALNKLAPGDAQAAQAMGQRAAA